MRTSLLSLAGLGAIAFIGATLQSPTPTQAAAPIYPWCMQPSGLWGPDCYYATFAQCQAAASGVGFCYENPAFTGSTQGKPERTRR